MWFYKGRADRWAQCRSCPVGGPLVMDGYRRIKWSWLDLNVMWDRGWPGPCEMDGHDIPVPEHLRPACRAWAAGSMPCWAFADWCEENLPNLVPQPVLDLLREECENLEPVGVV